MRIGIIGYGTFGQFLGQHFHAAGFEVIATSRKNYASEALQSGVSYRDSMEDFLEEELDVLLIASSISSFSEVVSKLDWDKVKAKLVVDVLSVKAFPKEVLKRTIPNHLDILCTHPMFGPDSGKGAWDGLNFMYDPVRIRHQELYQQLLGFFEDRGCTMIQMTCEKHDSFAASTQFITHTTGRLLHNLQPSSTPINTKGYESLLELVKNTVNDSFDLYYGLYKYNDNAQQELARFEASLREVKNSLFNRARQERSDTVIGIQGGNGSFNHEAALELIDKYRLQQVTLKYLITSERVLSELNTGLIDFGVFAIENSGSGTVLPSIYSMSKYPHEIIELHDMPLVQCLMTRPGQDISKARTIITHPQAIKQCRKTLDEKFPHLTHDYLSDDYDTAECAKKLSMGELEDDAVVIASKTAASKYGLTIAYEGLNDDKDNYTSFVFCKRREE